MECSVSVAVGEHVAMTAISAPGVVKLSFSARVRRWFRNGMAAPPPPPPLNPVLEAAAQFHRRGGRGGIRRNGVGGKEMVSGSPP